MRRVIAAVCITVGLVFPAAAVANPLVVSGKVSYYGPPYEAAGTTANGMSSYNPGIALRNSGTMNRYYCVTLHHGALHAVLQHIDWGPASFTGRAIDVTGAGVRKFQGKGGFYTDANAHARLLPRKHGPRWNCGIR